MYITHSFSMITAVNLWAHMNSVHLVKKLTCRTGSRDGSQGDMYEMFRTPREREVDRPSLTWFAWLSPLALEKVGL